MTADDSRNGDRSAMRLQVLPISPTATVRERAERYADALMQLVPAFNRMADDLSRLTEQALVVDVTLRRHADMLERYGAAAQRMEDRLSREVGDMRSKVASAHDLSEVAARVEDAADRIEEATNPGMASPLARTTPSDPVRKVVAGLWMRLGSILGSAAGKALEHGLTVAVTLAGAYALARVFNLLK